MKKQFEEKIKKHKILVIDDSSYQRLKTRRALKERGYQVMEASDGLEGLYMFREKKPDLVLLDINMPIMEGTEVLDFIFKINENAVVVMFSTLDEKRIIMECISKGARDFLVKPSDPKTLIETIEKYLHGK